MDRAGRKIGRDLSCVRCGYNLRGLSNSDHCPECNAPANASVLRQGFLRYSTHAPPLAESDATWVRSVVGGMGWLAMTIGIEFATPLVTSLNMDATLGWLVSMMLSMACWTCFGIGIWRITRPEPGAASENAWLVRATSMAYLVANITCLCLPGISRTLAGLALAGVYPTAVFLHIHLASLSRRLPAMWLGVMGRAAGFVAGLLGCTAALTGIGHAGPLTFGPVPQVGRLFLPGGFQAAAAHPAGAVAAVFGVAMGSMPLYFLALWYFRSRRHAD
jgi:hypothetical protein